MNLKEIGQQKGKHLDKLALAVRNVITSAVFFGDVTRFRFGCLGFPTEDFFLATLTLLAPLPTDFSFPGSQRL